VHDVYLFYFYYFTVHGHVVLGVLAWYFLQ